LLVPQLASELSPSGVGNGLRETVIAQHPGHIEVLYDEAVVSLDQPIGDLM
jgi:hypothetical protein